MTFFDPSEWDGKLYSSGWVAGGAGSKPIFEPATQGTIGNYGNASPEDVTRAAHAAVTAQKSWAAASYEERAGVLRRAGTLIEENADVLGDWLVREAGSAKGKAGFERPGVRRVLRGLGHRHGTVRAVAAQRQAQAKPGPPHAGRRGRRDLAVQRPADPLHPVGGAGAGARQRRDPQARPPHRGHRRGRTRPRSSTRRACRRACSTCCPAAPMSARRW